MYPVLFHLGPIPVRAYGLLAMLGFVTAAYIAYRRAPRSQIDPEFILDLLLPTLVAGIIGARVLYVALDYGSDPMAYRTDPWLPLKFWLGGLSWHGALFSGLATIVWIAKRRRIPSLTLLDALAPGVPLGHAIARVGCFLNGCCYGYPTDLPWACEFQIEGTSRWTPPSHPAQLYESLGNLLIVGALLWFDRRPRPPGTLAWLYLLLYSLTRFVVEFFRSGATASTVAGLGLTVGQLASLVIALAAGGLLVHTYRRRPATAAQPTHKRKARKAKR